MTRHENLVMAFTLKATVIQLFLCVILTGPQLPRYSVYNVLDISLKLFWIHLTFKLVQ